ncbi:MAG: glycerate kinase [Granulosicoccus sp.]
MTDSMNNPSTLLKELFQAGVDAVGGFQATTKALHGYELGNSVYLVAVGKASDSMALGALKVLGDKLVSGLVITKHDHLSEELRGHSKLSCIESGHPLPDEHSLLAGQKLVEFVSAIPEAAELVFLVSGGTSALVEHLNVGLTLDDLKRETDTFLSSGADIGAMNKHRRTLSNIKGGKLSSFIKCNVHQFLISDVPGDKLSDIGSGLLIPDDATGMPATLPVWNRIKTRIIASSDIAQAAVEQAAEARGLLVIQKKGSLHGQMPQVVGRLSETILIKNAQAGVYIWGGEPTVVLPENPGRGGRNQHLALALSKSIAAHGRGAVLVCGTDGTDGPTKDAGGLVTESTASIAASKNLDIDDYLKRADAGSCLEQLDALVTTGPTGTNVMDLAIVILQ